MPAFLIQKGTNYACNLGDCGDLLCLQSQLGWVTNMPGILFQKGTKYMPAIVSERDPICLQCLKIFKHLQSDRVGLKSHLKKGDGCS